MRVSRQMVRRDGAGELGRGAADNLHGLFRRQMLQHHAQAGKRLEERQQRAIDEHALAVEHIDAVARILAMHQERHVVFFHAREYGICLGDVGDAGGGIRGGMRRVELRGREHAATKAAFEIVRVGGIREIAGHQRREGYAFRERRQDPCAVGDRVRGGDHRGHEIGHDDRTGEMPRRAWQHGGEHGAVAHMQVPVVRPANGDAPCHVKRRSARGGRPPSAGLSICALNVEPRQVTTGIAHPFEFRLRWQA